MLSLLCVHFAFHYSTNVSTSAVGLVCVFFTVNLYWKPCALLASVEVQRVFICGSPQFQDKGDSQTISTLEVENLSWSICQILCNHFWIAYYITINLGIDSIGCGFSISRPPSVLQILWKKCPGGHIQEHIRGGRNNIPQYSKYQHWHFGQHQHSLTYIVGKHRPVTLGILGSLAILVSMSNTWPFS